MQPFARLDCRQPKGAYILLLAALAAISISFQARVHDSFERATRLTSEHLGGNERHPYSSRARLRHSSNRTDSSQMHLVVCTRVRNEAPYLREWIEYHRMIGFEAFLLMNDNSTDDTQCILDAYARGGLVIRIPNDIDDRNHKLNENNDNVFDACADYLKNQQHAFDPSRTWLMSHDVDEFVYYNKTEHDSLHSAMQMLLRKGMGSIQSMMVPRLFFGSSSREHYEDGLVIERFNHRFHRGRCPGRQRRRAKWFHRPSRKNRMFPRRRLAEAAPTSYCTHGRMQDSYRNVKSISLVSSLALNCSWVDRKTGSVMVDNCSRTHWHTLVDNRRDEKTNTTIPYHAKESNKFDNRYLPLEKVHKAVSIMYYGIKSREEFYHRVCSSVWHEKYYQCTDCNPETYFENTETFANNYRDDRMAPFAAELKTILAASTVGSNCDTKHVPRPLDFYRECIERRDGRKH